MTFLQVVVLAVIQGLTEFLPISSSAHLILPSAILGWPDQGLAFDVAVHVGTLIAVVIYFRRDLALMISAWVQDTLRGRTSENSRLAWFVALATIPAGIFGLLFNDFIEAHLRSVAVIATTTIVFGVMLGIFDRYSPRSLSLNQLGWKQALIVGFAQVLALIPGTSRSGVTITAALALGFDRISSAKFSFLLSIPIIALSGGYKSLELLHASDVPWRDIFVATVLSSVTAYACIHSFLAFVNRIGMMPFVWYRMILGVSLLGLLAFGLVGN